jgi:hypothetical protein
MFDLTKTHYTEAREYAVKAGQTITEEAQLLVFVDNLAGGMAVQPCSTGAAQKYAGFALTDAMKVLTETVVDTVTVPTGGGTVFLGNTNIVSGSERVVASVTGVLTEDCASLGAGEYCLVDATGAISFVAAQQGETVTVTYRYNLTLQQSLERFHERSINNRAQDYFSSVSVLMGEGEIFTSMFDTSVNYTIGSLVYPAAGGKVSSVAGGASNALGFVSKLPSTTDGLLGIKFNFPVQS